MISNETKARFAREVAKFPADQKQSAVMACLAIVQQELGWVSAESEKVVADYLGMAPMAVHEVTTFYNMYNQQKLGKYKLTFVTIYLASCMVVSKPWFICKSVWAFKWVKLPLMACSLCSPANAKAHAPMRLCCWSTTAPCAAS